MKFRQHVASAVVRAVVIFFVASLLIAALFAISNPLNGAWLLAPAAP